MHCVSCFKPSCSVILAVDSIKGEKEQSCNMCSSLMEEVMITVELYLQAHRRKMAFREEAIVPIREVTSIRIVSGLCQPDYGLWC